MFDLRNTLRRPVRMHPDKVATVWNDQEYTYTQFSERCIRLANGLVDLGLDRGDRVAVLMLNSHRFLELYYATMIAGMIIVPLNIRWGQQEFAFALSDCQPKVFAIDQTIYGHLKDHMEALKMLGIQHYLFADEDTPEGLIDYETLISDSSHEDPNLEVSEDDLIGLFYTSGTTSHPKGVMLTHKNLMANSYHGQLSFGFDTGSRYLHAAPMFHLADLAGTFTVSWNGGTHTFIPRFDPGETLRAIERLRVSNTTLIPTMVNFMLHDPAMSEVDLSSLTDILYGGSSMPAELLRAAMPAFKCDFLQGYGMTEAAPLVTILNREDHRAAYDGQLSGEILSSAGKPILGVEVRVLDDDNNDVPQGEVGELCVQGPNVMKGYWNREDKTDEVMIDGWYHSRDMARVDEDGYYYIVDRKDDMIVTGGENVYSTEVESVIYEHPAVLEAAVIGVPDETWVRAVQGVVVLRDGAEASEEDIKNFCKEKLSHYKIPKHIVFTDELPKGGTGKILKNQIRDEYSKKSS